MKQQYHSTFLLISLIALLASVMQGCKKVEEHATYLESQPFLVKTVTMNGMFNLYEYNYRNRFLTGDTMILVGKLFMDDPSTYIQVGDVKVVPTDKRRLSLRAPNDRTGQEDSLDVVRFVITKEIGTGTGIPVKVSARGQSIFGEPITITALYIGDKRTDPSLVVEKIASWLPDNVADYQKEYISFVHSQSVTDDGVIWFDNVFGIYRLNGSQVVPVLKKGEPITDGQHQQFSIDYVIGSVISTDGQTLTFSAIVNENIPGADSLYISRLCQLNTTSNTIKTLNRTETYRGLGTYKEVPGPYSGPAGSLKIAAAFLRADVNGNIWFTNSYVPRNPTEYNTDYVFYNSVKHSTEISGGAVYVMSVLTPDGNVHAKGRFYYKPYPGSTPHNIPLPAICDDGGSSFLLSRDGSTILGYKNPKSGFVYDLNRFSVAENDITGTITAYKENFAFISYDDDPATKMPTNNVFSIRGTDYPFWNRFLFLPDNNILYALDNSLYAYDPVHMTAYCYAGTENQNTEVQNKQTGNAKYVDFQANDNLNMLGVDKAGTVYFSKGGLNEYVYNNDYTNGVSFYRLISKKN